MSRDTLDAAILRLLWSVIEALPSQDLLKLDGDILVHRILQKVNQQACLMDVDQNLMQAYLSARLPLIRTLAADQ